MNFLALLCSVGVVVCIGYISANCQISFREINICPFQSAKLAYTKSRIKVEKQKLSDLNFRNSVTVELLKLIGAAALLAAVTQIVIWKIRGDEISFADSGILAVCLLLAITIATIAAMIVPVRYILHIQPSEGVKL